MNFNKKAAWLFLSLYGLLCIFIFFINEFNPNQIGYLALLSYLIPPIIVLNLILLIYYLFNKKIYFFVPLILLTIALPYYKSSVGYKIKSTTFHTNSLSVLSFNSSFFSMNKVFSKAYLDPNQNLQVENIKSGLIKENADIICIQEFFDDNKNALHYNNIDYFIKNGYFVSFHGNERHPNGTRWGMAILSKYRIINSQPILLSENGFNGAFYCDITVGSDTLRILNIHLESLEAKQKIKHIRFTLTEMDRISKLHLDQLEKIIGEVENSPYRVIIAGDFNQTQFSYHYKLMKRNFMNAFEEGGFDINSTVKIFSLPFIKIDHIFYTGSPLGVVKFQILKNPNLYTSDHKPVKAVFTIL